MNAATFRHSWVKLREHVYLCRTCGMGRVNAQRRSGEWFTTFHKPDGRSVVAIHVPPCAPGRTTTKRLEHYRAQIAAAGERRRPSRINT